MSPLLLKNFKTSITFSALLATCVSTLGQSEPTTNSAPSNSVSPATTLERGDRITDQAALDIVLASANKFARLAKEYAGHKEELTLLMKQALQYEKAVEMSFRLAYQSPVTLTPAQTKARAARHSGLQKKLLGQLDLILARFKVNKESTTDLQKARFMRGVILQDIESYEQASADFIYLVEQFPNGGHLIAATLHIAEIAVIKKDYALAITYLTKLNLPASDSHYQIVMEKLADAYFNKGDFNLALKTNEARIMSMHKNSSTKSPINVRELERALKTSALYFSHARDVDQKTYSFQAAVDYFKYLAQGDLYGKALLAFTYQLRIKEFDADMIELNSTIQRAAVFAEQPEITYSVLEYLMGRRKYEEIERITLSYLSSPQRAAQPVSIRDASDLKIKRLTLKGAAALLNVASKTTHPEDVAMVQWSVTSLYTLALKASKPTDSDLSQIHFNRGESLFALKRYEDATQDYRWVVIASKEPTPKSKLVVEAHEKAIGSRYEALREANLIPVDLTPTKFESNPKKTLAGLNPLISEWVGWIDQSPKLEAFQFEANRAIYSQGRVTLACERLKAFGEKSPASKFAIPSLALLFDTMIASERFLEVESLTKRYIDLGLWKGTEFHAKLQSMAADSAMKLTESDYKAKNFASSLKRAQDYLATYILVQGKPAGKYASPQGSSHYEQALIIAAGSVMETRSSALDSASRKLALRYLTDLIERFPNSKATPQAYRTRAGLREEEFAYEAAYRDWVKVAQNSEDLLHALKLALISGENYLLQSALSTEQVCHSGYADENIGLQCENLRTLLLLQHKPKRGFTNKQAIDAFKNARRKTQASRIIWAALALEGVGALYYSDALELISVFHDQWMEISKSKGQIDPLIQTAIVPSISKTLPFALFHARTQIERLTKLRADEKSIGRRIEAIKLFEKSAKIALGLPYKRIQAAAVSELGLLYMSTYRDLRNLAEGLPTLYEPFKAKAKDLGDLAGKLLSENAIEETQVNTLAKLQSMLADGKTAPIAQWVGLIPVTSLKTEWIAKVESKSKLSDLSVAWVDHMSDALSKKQWPKVWALIARARAQASNTGTNNPIVSDFTVKLAQAVALSESGARSEAMDVIHGDMEQFAKLDIPQGIAAMVTSYFRSFAKAKVQNTMVRLVKPDPKLIRPLDLESLVAISLAGIWVQEPLPKYELEMIRSRIDALSDHKRNPLLKSYVDFMDKNQKLLLGGNP